MVTRIIGRSAAGVVAVLATLSLGIVAFAAPTPVTAGHSGQSVSPAEVGHQSSTLHSSNQYYAPSRFTNEQPCASNQSAFLDPYGDPMMSATAPSPYNTIGALSAGGPSLLSFFGYGNASLSSWWMSPAGQYAAQMGMNPLNSPCANPAMFLPSANW
ncbi:MAG: hypothetical protein JOZ28_07210 [Candidatus Eremiobacteraeota bacterium]|nr:hypothetical protein [Candidatus Eremiobacteraeota bacterium]MBV8668985.1 hypothetical protein [Candidatus Eremiobacteraeota bacterium]